MTIYELIDGYKEAIKELEDKDAFETIEYQAAQTILEVLENYLVLFDLNEALVLQNKQLKAELDDLAKLGLRN